MKHSMTRFALAGLVSLIIIGGLLASCQLFDHDNDALTAPTSEGGQSGNFIIGDQEISGWGGYYHPNNTFFAINVPAVGALNISYTIKNGGGYALFVETPGATKMEIGLNTINGVTDALDSVCVSYAEGVTAFASVPAGVVKAKQHGATHYRRKHDAGESDWWPLDAAFAFGVADAQVKTVCVMQNGALGVTEISGPFPKAAPVTPVKTAYVITATAGANGGISPSGAVTVNSGASQSFTITPNSGYAIQDVTVDGSTVGAVSTYTFPNVTGPHTITASFTPTCGGVMVGGFCWRVTAQNQSCQTLCSGFGNYNTAALNFWGTGTQAQCQTILAHFGFDLSGGFLGGNSSLVHGCYHTLSTYYDIASATPQDLTSAFMIEIACACNN